ncbi:MAG: hypothetical protein ACI9RU_003235 [Litorivivens sp.]|jgi:hypothetical protein
MTLVEFSSLVRKSNSFKLDAFDPILFLGILIT